VIKSQSFILEVEVCARVTANGFGLAIGREFGKRPPTTETDLKTIDFCGGVWKSPVESQCLIKLLRPA